MEDLFKKFIYTGVGFAAMTAEKLQEAVDDLVGKGKLSKDEGKKIVDDFFENTESKKEEFESKLKEAADTVMDKLSLPTKSEFDALKKKVEDLEAKLAEAEAKAANKTTTRKKTATGKSTAAKKTTRKSTKTKKDKDEE
jgi:polyhydroxyalkanoate synthesis regulator phasin